MSISVLSPTGWKSLGADPNAWTRPADWLPMSVVAGTQKVQCLLAIGADTSVEANRVMSFAVSGNYTVDWGDGTAPQNFAANAVAQHLYNPANLSGSLTSEGFYQALMTVTPQGAANLTIINFSNVYYATKTWRSPVLEIVVGHSGLTGLTLGGVTPLLRRVEFKQPFTPTTPANLFLNCYNLREVVGEIIFSSITATAVFSGCTLVSKFPKLTFTQTANINVAQFFLSCPTLVEPPLFNAPAGSIVTWTSTYSGCTSMRRLPAGFTVQGATTISGLFTNCSSMTTFPQLDTAVCTSMTNAFNGCATLRTVSFTSTAAAQNVSSMFLNCFSLESVVNLDFSAVNSAANIASFVAGCYRLCQLKFLAGKGPAWTWTLIGQIDVAGINDIYTQLPVVSGQTITVTNVAGTLTDDPTIATAKGWTVTG
jgi:hypothetical protein